MALKAFICATCYDEDNKKLVFLDEEEGLRLIKDKNDQ